MEGGGEGAVAFCADFLPPCGSIRLPVKNGQLKFHNFTMKDILSTVRHVSLTVQGHVPIYIYIYHLLQNSKRQGCEKPEQGAQMSWKCGQYHENSS